MNDKKTGNLAVIAGIFIFGINFVSMKYLIDYIPPTTLSFLRFAIASIFLLFITKLREIKAKNHYEIKSEDKVAVMISGFLGVAIYYFFQGMALVYISASLAALICSMIPIFTLLTNVLIYKKKLEGFLVINFIVAIIGVLLVLDIKWEDPIDFNQLMGMALMFMAVFSWIAYTIKTYQLQRKYDSIFLLYKQINYGTILLFIASIFNLRQIIYISIADENLLPILANLFFVGVISSALGYLFYIYGMEKLGVDIASLYMNLIPAVTAIFSYFVLMEPMTMKKAIGILLVILSLYAVSLKDWIQNKRSATVRISS
ncbi:DMT family transporter [Alkaliphilus serpentinus]|uniref:DMT family transporter n=1 Tax=Alkaliphilus serpentinus TaxID=1482731 RepID=A0A833HM27_9FIRM|nr:DMT family transporter [Alkaliphilus serpentinus]KAB3527270.1 DMT family transporter [Alkaliphilus serpentinus]